MTGINGAKIRVTDTGNTAIELKHWFASDEFNKLYTYDGDDLGAVYHKDYTVFKVWAPTAEKIVLNLYQNGSSEETAALAMPDRRECFLLKKGKRGTWQVNVPGDLEGVYYTYSVTVDGETQETADPYARACGVNGRRSMVVDLAETNPDGWEMDKRPQGITEHPVIYELHVKDFSSDSHSGVDEKWRGKYLAFTAENTSLDGQGQFPTCMSYLKQMGITYVHLLPSYDFGSVDEAHPEWDQFNWGYDPVNYNVPEGSYATDARDGHVRIREFKEMVMALHQAGIGVIMDVVFNHTYDMSSPLQKMVPGYYYRMYEDGRWANGSACGNDTASERRMFGQYMADSVCYWAKEYHIDGFRFDLMGLHDTETMNMIRRRLDELTGGKDILMYGEPWSAADTAWENNAIPANMSNLQLLDERIAVFCDRTRDGVKGSTFEAEEPGYVNGNSQDALAFKKDIESAVCAWCGQGRNPERLNPKSPSQIISYISAHDDRTLWDKLVVSVKEKPDYTQPYEDILQMNKLAAGIVMTSMGTPFFMAGEEFGRTKNGSDNSYNLPSYINQLDWQRSAAYEELVSYYRFLISLRHELPLLERKDEEAAKQIQFIERDDAVIGFVLGDASTCRLWQRAVIYYNPYDCRKNVSLPEGKWRLISNGMTVHKLQGAASVKNKLILEARSVTILGEK